MPQNSSSRNNRSRIERFRDGWRLYRPGRDDYLNDFINMPRLPESAFQPHTPLLPGVNNLIHDYSAYLAADADISYLGFSEEGSVNTRAAVPTNGYDGKKVGMVRCRKCKSWFDPIQLVSKKCFICRGERPVVVNKQVNDDKEDKQDENMRVAS